MVHFSLLRPLESIVGYENADRLQDVAYDFRDNEDFMIVFREVLQEKDLDLPKIWNENRSRGLIRSCPIITKSAIRLTGWFCGVLTIKTVYALAQSVPFTKYGKNKKERRDRERYFKDIFIKPATVKPVSSMLPPPSAQLSGFFSLPAELRIKILVFAFGERTLHMSLEYQHPFYIANERRQGYPTHAKIEKLAGFDDSHLRTDIPKKWIWFGCVCHRCRPASYGNVPLSLGRIMLGSGGPESRYQPGTRNQEIWRGDLDLEQDLCLQGFGYCSKWEGTWPEKCHIGIMGWLLTCRQAYLNGIHVLYRTNTIHIASVELHRSLPDILSSTIISNITSLELVWDSMLSFDDGFTSKKSTDIANKLKPLLSSLKFLRIGFDQVTTSRRHQPLGCRWNALAEEDLGATLNDHILPMMDRFIERIAPSSADVTVSCLNWNWYIAIERRLTDTQGEERSKPQSANIGGMKVWRLSPQSSQGGSEVVEESLSYPGAREGIWIHVAPREIPISRLDDEMLPRPLQ